eukprot:GHRR01028988.1.p1 GENE.GHRR01028988.1~~GHRR01028988.1.p1  ORF type:complete len:136 (+),score=36.27 GHRR01028988.1:171-578(+)
MVRQLPLLLCCLGWLFTVTQGTMQKGASISVRARWQGTSYLLEAAEFLADESQQSYWQFLDSLTLPGNSNSSGSSDDSTACWHSVLDQSAGLCWPQVAKVCSPNSQLASLYLSGEPVSIQTRPLASSCWTCWLGF